MIAGRHLMPPLHTPNTMGLAEAKIAAQWLLMTNMDHHSGTNHIW